MLTNQQLNEYVFGSLSTRLLTCNPSQWRRLLRFPNHGKVLIAAPILSSVASVLYGPQTSSSCIEIHLFQTVDKLIGDRFAGSESLGNRGAL